MNHKDMLSMLVKIFANPLFRVRMDFKYCRWENTDQALLEKPD